MCHSQSVCLYLSLSFCLSCPSLSFSVTFSLSHTLSLFLTFSPPQSFAFSLTLFLVHSLTPSLTLSPTQLVWQSLLGTHSTAVYTSGKLFFLSFPSLPSPLSAPFFSLLHRKKACFLWTLHNPTSSRPFHLKQRIPPLFPLALVRNSRESTLVKKGERRSGVEGVRTQEMVRGEGRDSGRTGRKWGRGRKRGWRRKGVDGSNNREWEDDSDDYDYQSHNDDGSRGKRRKRRIKSRGEAANTISCNPLSKPVTPPTPTLFPFLD